MCVPVVTADRHVGASVVSICDDPVDCILGRLDDAVNGASKSGPARGVMAAFLATAKTLIIELDYFDIDYRSEIALIQPHSFSADRPQTQRWHFFSAPLRGRTYIRDWIENNSRSYCGYTIIRPQIPGTIGRTIVTTKGHHPGLASDSTLSEQVRSIAAEHLELFGVSLIAKGVPFMEQDGHILRCAHVSAWISHYTAVLRGTAARRTTGAFHAFAGHSTHSRSYPSAGLSHTELGAMLSAFGLPPEITTSRSLVADDRQFYHWADRSTLMERIERLDARSKLTENDWSTKADLALIRLSIRESLVGTICRYLNSGFPSIACHSGVAANHTVVIVGYLRGKDLDRSGSGKSATVAGRFKDASTATHSDIVGFIVSDDMKGPYELAPIEHFVNAIFRQEMIIMTPLPRVIWLSGSRAERAAVRWLESAARLRLDAAQQRLPDESHLAALASFEKGTSELGADRFTVRSYVVESSDLKRSISARLKKMDANLVREICQMQLPKYVWVCEAIDRELRRQGGKSVVAMAGIDATAALAEHPDPLHIRPLFIHIPGEAYVDGLSKSSTMRWFAATDQPYYSGRWGNAFKTDRFVAASRILARWKTARAD